MNRTIRDFAVGCEVAPAQLLDDPETDAYRTYDRLTRFVEQTKQYYMNRAAQQCLEICSNSESGAQAADRIREQFGIDV